MLRDGYSDFKFFQAMVPALNDAANGLQLDGVSVDRQGYDTVVFVIDVGLVESMTAGTSFHQLKLEHYNSVAAAWSEVYPSQMLHSVVGQDGAYSVLDSGIFQSIAHSTMGSVTYFVGYKGPHRICRIGLSGELNSGASITIGAIAILGLPSNWPVNTPI